MSLIQRSLVWVLSVALWTLGCSGSEESENASASPMISVFEQDSVAGQNGSQVASLTTSTGDEGERRGDVFDAMGLVGNRKPQIRSLSIERVDSDTPSNGEGEMWRAAVFADDLDGDSLEIEYRWLVNGVESDIEDEFYPAMGLKRGDQLAVRARAYDGNVWSVPVGSGQVEIGNNLPTILSVPPRPGPTGYFRYAVDVKDSGEDANLHFALRTAPRGMRIDESSGVVTWQPGSDQAGRHEVEIIVLDGDGGEATQTFSLALVSVSESASSPAAPR
jgi:hypothetical protein